LEIRGKVMGNLRRHDKTGVEKLYFALQRIRGKEGD